MRYPERFWNRIAKKYAARPVANEPLYRSKLKHTQGYMSADMLVLEFGCGTGSTALEHAAHVKHYDALDFSEEMLAIAEEKRQQRAVDNVKFKRLAIEDLEVEAESYDMVIGLSVLHLLKDPTAVLFEVKRVLKPGGLFVSSTACIQDFMPFFRFVAPMLSRTGLIPKVQCFGRDSLLQMHRQNGFNIEFELEQSKRSDAIFLIARKSEIGTIHE